MWDGIDGPGRPEQRRRLLAVAVGIAGAATVAQADVEVAVATGGELAAVVVRVRLRDLEELAARVLVDVATGVELVLEHDGAPVGCRGEVDVEPTAVAREGQRSEEHTSELQSLMRISYAVFCLKKKTNIENKYTHMRYQNI